MSTFYSISTAQSGMIAARRALDVAGQNVANANTPGYTRQRVDTSAVPGMTMPSLHSGASVGNGVQVDGITRMGDSFLETRVRSESGSAGFYRTQISILSGIESTLAEPSDTSITARLTEFFTSFQDLANSPEDPTARAVVLGNATSLVNQIADGYRGVETQWSQTRRAVDAVVVDVNTAAKNIAEMNKTIRGIVLAGGNANELIDQRNLAVTELAAITGATARYNEDGTMDVSVGGNALVRGVKSYEVEVTGSYTMTGATTASPLEPLALRWKGTGTSLTLTSGSLAAQVQALAPASEGGAFAQAAQAYNDLATEVAAAVNSVHSTGFTLETPPRDGVDFFSFVDPTTPPAVGLRVAITDPMGVAAAAPGAGGFDGTIADQIASLVTQPGGPGENWQAFVIDAGVQVRTADQRATVTEVSRATAESLLLSQTSVDIDEETLNMLTFQRMFEGSARLITAMNEILDTVINLGRR